MKRIEAYIQPFMLTRVMHELREVHVHGLTVSDVRGFGREKDESYPHDASDYAVDFTPKVKLEIIAADLVAALDPYWLEVTGAFKARGGLTLTVVVTHDKPSEPRA